MNLNKNFIPLDSQSREYYENNLPETEKKLNSEEVNASYDKSIWEKMSKELNNHPENVDFSNIFYAFKTLPSVRNEIAEYLLENNQKDLSYHNYVTVFELISNPEIANKFIDAFMENISSDPDVLLALSEYNFACPEAKKRLSDITPEFRMAS
jgi:hypothetical protein